MLLIAGLGNPEASYARNRHNIGFMAVDAIARRHGFSLWAKKFKSEIATGLLNGEKTLLIKPQTYMNNSGQAVGEAVRFYKLAISDVLVIYDELDINAGKLRIKTGGGAGGHNGIRSIDAHCGKEYRRLRMGIGHPGRKELVSNYVLGDFAKVDFEWLEPLLENISENADLLTEREGNKFLNKMGLIYSPNKVNNKKQSHIHQARSNKPQLKKAIEGGGPMADMLKKLLATKKDKS